MSTALNPDEHLGGSGNRISPALRTEALEQRPTGTENLSEEQLTALVTRDAMVGVAHVSRPENRR